MANMGEAVDFFGHRWSGDGATLHSAMKQEDKTSVNEIIVLRARCERAERALKFILEECDWEESLNGGDYRIGIVCKQALAGTEEKS